MATPPGRAFRVFVESSGSGPVHSGLAVVNTALLPNAITLSLTRFDGTPLGVTPVVLPPGGQISRFARELFPEVQEGFQGVLKLTSELPVAVAGLRGFFNSRGDYLMSAVPAIDDGAPLAESLVLPHIVNGGGYETQIIIIGQAGEARSGFLSLTQSDGTMVAQTKEN
jgi:hypothetical protein